MPRNYRLLLGGIGDDAHSIGLKIIQLSLQDHGFFVTSIGIQNKLEDFFEEAMNHEIILISSINGHSFIHMQNFKALKETLDLRTNETKLWYLGGNIAINRDSDGVVKYYLDQGLTRVFPKPVSTDVIIETLKKDIHRYNIKKHELFSNQLNRPVLVDTEADHATDEYYLDNFEADRKEVLTHWKTGNEVNYEIAYQNLKKSNNLDHLLWSNKVKGSPPLIQPRTGVATLEKQVELFKKLEKFPIDITSVQLDAACRNNNYKDAARYVEESLIHKESLLNGFPVPIHGVKGIMKLIESTEKPFQIRGGSPDHRLTYEIGIAGGTTGVEGGFICYLFPYDKKTSPSKSLHYWKYVDALAGEYYRRYNIVINREFFGTLTAALIEPSIAIVVNIVQSIISLKNNVKSITVGIAEQGNRIQDIAAMVVLEKLTHCYLHKNGFSNYHLTTVFHQYMSCFPKDEILSERLIHESAITATLAGATKIMTKTPVESFKIPSVEENGRGVSITKEAIKQASSINVNYPLVEKEVKLIEAEVISILEMIEKLGHGEYSKGIIKAFEFGLFDIPFSPNNYNNGKLITFRNIDGAIRFANPELMPFPEWVKEFHNNELHIKKLYDKESELSRIVQNDVMRIWNCNYKYWPLDFESLS